MRATKLVAAALIALTPAAPAQIHPSMREFVAAVFSVNIMGEVKILYVSPRAIDVVQCAGELQAAADRAREASRPDGSRMHYRVHGQCMQANGVPRRTG